MNCLETTWSGSGKLCSKWSFVVWMSSYRSSSEAPTWTHHFLSLLQKSLMQRWMTCLGEQTNTPYSKTMFGQLLNRSWSPIVRPRTTRHEVLSPQTNQDKIVRGRLVNISRIRPDWPPSVSHMRDFFQWSIICQTSDGQSQSKQIQLNEIKIEGVFIIRITTIPPSNARVSITRWIN